MPNVMVALLNIGGAFCSMPQSLADAHYSTQKVAQKSPCGHRGTNLSGYVFATKARIDNRKKKTC